MTLVDTSVWIDHLRNGNRIMERMLQNAEVLVHPFVVGELALGRISNRAEIMDLLANLPSVEAAENQEVMHMIEKRDLAGSGIGWIDAHLVAAALMAHASLFTFDKALLKAARKLRIAAGTEPGN
jgi:predicted nucleic acid-binding protein